MELGKTPVTGGPRKAAGAHSELQPEGWHLQSFFAFPGGNPGVCRKFGVDEVVVPPICWKPIRVALVGLGKSALGFL